MKKPDYVYVASSWKNIMQVGVCAALRSAGIDHYDFKKAGPKGDGFRWTEVMTDVERGREHNDLVLMESYIKALDHPRTQEGFHLDFDAMDRADACVLVLPCGRSAHLELGWMVGQGKRTAILLDPDDDGRITPDLMYLMVDYIAPSLFDLLGWLGVED